MSNNNALYQTELPLVKIAEFARDMAIYGLDDLEGVLAAHNISAEQAVKIVESPVYKTEYKRIEAQLADPHGALRIKAQNMLPSGIDVVGEIAMSRAQPATARLKAVDMLTKLAQVSEEEEKQGPSVVLHLDFGGVVQVPSSQTIPVQVQDNGVALPNGWTLED